MRITKARKIGDKDHNKYLEESQQLVTIYSGQLLALLLMNGFNMPTTSLYRNCNTTCAEFSKTIFADFLEMDHCFGSAGWIVHCVNLEDFVALLPYFRKCGNIARKTAFCLATGILKIMGSSLKLLGGGGGGGRQCHQLKYPSKFKRA